MSHVRTPGCAAPSSLALPCRQVLEDEAENPMVRHEAAEALGSIADPQCLQLLRQVRCAGPREGSPCMCVQGSG